MTAAVPSAMGVVWRLASATALIVLAFSMAAPVLAISLKQAGHSTATIGAFAMIPVLMIGVLIPVVPRGISPASVPEGAARHAPG